MNSSECSHRGQPAAAPILSLAIAAVPVQPWETPYEPAISLKRGTVFPNLYLPFYVGGEQNG